MAHAHEGWRLELEQHDEPPLTSQDHRDERRPRFVFRPLPTDAACHGHPRTSHFIYEHLVDGMALGSSPFPIEREERWQ